MPVKLKKSQSNYIKNTNKYVTTHFYIKSTPLVELQKEYDNCFTTDRQGATVTKQGKGRMKVKIQNELVKRGVMSHR
jgi:hypothetical protein